MEPLVWSGPIQGSVGLDVRVTFAGQEIESQVRITIGETNRAGHSTVDGFSFSVNCPNKPFPPSGNILC